MWLLVHRASGAVLWVHFLLFSHFATKEEEEFFQSAAENAKETHHFRLTPSRNVSRGH